MVHMTSLICSLALTVGYASLVQSQSETAAEAKMSGKGITGVVKFEQHPNTTGLVVNVLVQGLKLDIGYPYRIHVNIVPSNGPKV
ncbi:hypothetical protein BG003_003432 [Podila horticola]|nr:hypothetical protein BG003_003432 [Podila horticola]